MLNVQLLDINNCLKAAEYMPINNEKIQKMTKAENLPPIVVYRDIEDYYVIVDGLHRWTAAKQQGKETIPGVIIPESIAEKAIENSYEMESISEAVYKILRYDARCEAAYDDEVNEIKKLFK